MQPLVDVLELGFIYYLVNQRNTFFAFVSPIT
jgi:hypothetical protein